MASEARILAAAEGIKAGLEQSSLIGEIWLWNVPWEMMQHSGDGKLTLAAADDAQHGARGFQPVFWSLGVKLPFPTDEGGEELEDTVRGLLASDGADSLFTQMSNIRRSTTDRFGTPYLEDVEVSFASVGEGGRLTMVSGTVRATL